MNIKSYTDIEQSKKLAEILPLDTADMCFVNDGTAIKIDANPYNVRKHMWKGEGVQLIPCWSLASLLGIISNYTLQKIDKNVFVVYENEETIIGTEDYDNPVDACVAMIEKLHELKML